MFKRILVAVDGSTTASRGLKVAIGLARDQGATLDVLHVIDNLTITPAFDGGGYIPPAYVDELIKELQDHGRKVLAKSEALARKDGVRVRTVLVETSGKDVAHAILSQARKLKSDVIVLGTHGRRGLRRIVLGSDAEAVVRDSTVPVLLVRGKAPAKG